MLKYFKLAIKMTTGILIISVAIIGIPIGAPMWLPALFGVLKKNSEFSLNVKRVLELRSIFLRANLKNAQLQQGAFDANKNRPIPA